MPTPSNKLEADYTGTQPGDGPRRAGCTCGPPAPSLPRGGRGAALIPRPTHPAREEGEGEAFLEKLKGSPSGLRASKARHQTPTSGRNQRSRNRVSPPSRLRGRGREEGARARGSRREAVRTLLSQGPPPPAQASAAPAAPAARSGTIFRAPAVADWSPALPRAPPACPRPPPLSASSRPQPPLRPRGRTPAPGKRRASPPGRLPPARPRPLPRPRKGAHQP